MMDKQVIHKMGYADDTGRRMEMYLCCFCKNLPDLELKHECEHFSLISDSQCPYFERVKNQSERIEGLLSAKYDV